MVNRKYLSILCLLIFTSEFVLVLLPIESISCESKVYGENIINEKIMHPSSSSVVWFNDCENTTGWELDPSPPDNLDYPDIVFRDDLSLSSNGSHLSCDIPSSASYERHGGVFFQSIESPFSLEGIELSVFIDRLYITDRIGNVVVGLHDEAKNTILWVKFTDAWYGPKIALLEGYRYGTDYRYGCIDYIGCEPWRGYLKIRHDSNTGNIVGTLPTGDHSVVNITDVNPNQEVHYASVFFWTYSDSSYVSPLIANITVRKNDYNGPARPNFLHQTPTEPLEWHHDCSNTTGWESNAALPGISYSSLLQDDIPLYSDGTSLYSGAIPWPNGWEGNHGSRYLLELEDPFSIYGLDLRVQIEHIATSNRMGSVTLALHDEMMNINYLLRLGDNWYSTQYYTSLGFNSFGDPGVMEDGGIYQGSGSGQYRVWYDEATSSIRGQDPSNTYEIAASGTFYNLEEVHYISLIFSTLQDATYESPLVQDIQLSGFSPKTSLESASTTLPISSTTSPTTSQADLGGFNPLLIVIIGMGGIIVVVVIILFKRSSTGGSSETPYGW